jgi:hypothetical protein
MKLLIIKQGRIHIGIGLVYNLLVRSILSLSILYISKANEPPS